METEKIISLLNNYESIGASHLAEISELKKKYPWFSTLHALEAKCLKNDNKFGLKKSVKSASLFAGDREHLYDFLHDQLKFEVDLTASKVDERVTIAPVGNDLQQEILEQDPNNELSTTEKSRNEEPTEQNNKVDEVSEEELKIVEETQPKIETDTSEAENDDREGITESDTITSEHEKEELEQGIKVDSLTVEKDLEQEPRSEFPSSEKAHNEEPTEQNSKVDEVSGEELKIVDETQPKIENDTSEAENDDDGEEITESDTITSEHEKEELEQDIKVDSLTDEKDTTEDSIQLLEGTSNIEEKVEETKEEVEEATPTKPKKKGVEIIYDPLVELQSQVDNSLPKKPVIAYDPLVELTKLEQDEEKKDKLDFFSWLDNLEEDKPKETPKPRKLVMTEEASQLLENFIKNRPRITKIRKDIDRLEVYTSKKETPEFELVTESLAKLHIKQQRPEKAIEIYEKLSLQNPEKFSYFAALIEKVKQDFNLEE